jgi:transposase InsO family protein
VSSYARVTPSSDNWRIDYNEVRPHSALGNRTPNEYATGESLPS